MGAAIALPKLGTANKLAVFDLSIADFNGCGLNAEEKRPESLW